MAPIVPPALAPTTRGHDRGNGNRKDRGKAKGKDKNDLEVTPVAETVAPADPVSTVVTVVPVVPVASAPTPPEVPVVASDDDKHGRGHGKYK